MSDQTALNLRDAEEYFSAKEKEATARKDELLTAVAELLPRHAKKLAKGTAHSEPEVTRSLGAEGVSKLRSELDAMTEELAADIAGAASQIKWPTVSDNATVKSNDVHSSLFHYLYGSKVNRFAQVFKNHGFHIHDDNNRKSQGLVLPQSFYSEEELAAEIHSLGAALMEFRKAERAVEAAKTANDADAVNKLWGD